MSNQRFEIPFETSEEKDALDFIERRQGDLTKSNSSVFSVEASKDLKETPGVQSQDLNKPPIN
jgi:hypothetical protein